MKNSNYMDFDSNININFNKPQVNMSNFGSSKPMTK